MLKMIQWCRGYVRIRIWGRSPERFLNLCSHRNILLWDIRRKEKFAEMYISLKAFRSLRPIAHKTGVRVVITERVGLPFLLPFLRKRTFFCLGLMAAVLFWIFSSFFIWEIECNGNYQLTDEVLLQFLKTKDIKIGMSKKVLDINFLERELRSEFQQITWTSAKLRGTRLIVDIKENDVALDPQIISRKQAADLIAEKEGTICSIIVRAGVPKVSYGEEVKEGTVLVEGTIPIMADDGTVKSYFYTEADADIRIAHSVICEEVLPRNYVEKEYSGRKKERYFIRIGEWMLKLSENVPYLYYDIVTEEKSIWIFRKLQIPLSWGKISTREYRNVEHSYGLEEAKEILSEKMLKNFKNLSEKGVHIIEKNVRIDTDQTKWSIIAELWVEEPVGIRVSITERESEAGQQ